MTEAGAAHLLYVVPEISLTEKIEDFLTVSSDLNYLRENAGEWD